MLNYKLNEKARMDLECLYEHGLLSFGVDQADRYYDGLIDPFSELAKSPLLWQAVEHIRRGSRRSVYAVHSIYDRIDGETIEIMRIMGRENQE